MKKLIASAGLVAVGATGLQAAYAPGLSPLETAKPWSISATVRGFYDDNWASAPSSDPGKKDSFGIEVSPSAAINIPMDQTYFGASYIYTLRYFEGRPDNNFDHTHEANLKFDHRFNERYKISVKDSFVYSQEPDVISEAGTAAATFRRTDASAFRNRAGLEFTAQLSELVSLNPGYELTWYDYLDEGPASHSAMLDRLEHLIHLDAKYQIREHVLAGLGYAFGAFDYTSNESIYAPPAPPTPGNVRDNQLHRFYATGDWAVSSQLNASAKAGVQYTTYEHLSDDSWSPFFDLNGTYTYLPGSYVQLGVRHALNATDVAGTGPTDITKDQESTVVYASVNHRFTREITGSLVGQYQYGVFQGGSLDGLVDQYFAVGLNVEYRLNANWAVDLGYNFDRLDSDLGRSFSRNRIYLGASATY